MAALTMRQQRPDGGAAARAVQPSNEQRCSTAKGATPGVNSPEKNERWKERAGRRRKALARVAGGTVTPETERRRLTVATVAVGVRERDLDDVDHPSPEMKAVETARLEEANRRRRK